jgi:hypothetical protein
MKLSVRAVTVVGMVTARDRPQVKGILLSSTFGTGVVGCPRLQSVVESQSSHSGISFERSVTISEKLHMGGLGDPPNERHRARNAIAERTMMLCTAARAEWLIHR